LLLPRKSQQQQMITRANKLNVCSNNNGASCVDGSPTITTSLSSSNNDNIIDKIAQSLGIDQLFHQNSPRPSLTTTPATPKEMRGKVIRTAARPHQSSGGSIPSSPQYTTRKPSLPLIAVSTKGVSGDYNHWRTVALKSTASRAISILTRDVGAYIQTLDGGHFATKGGGYKDGDLGENVLVEGVEFDFFKVGGRYRFASSSKQGGSIEDAAGEEDVIVEITEMMEPCANLCKLPYVNDPKDTPSEKVGRCQYLIAALGQKEGLRGWYAKVVKGGIIRIGDMAAMA